MADDPHRPPEGRTAPDPGDEQPSRWTRLRTSGGPLWTRFRTSGGLRWVAAAAGAFVVLFLVAWFTCGFQGCPDPRALLAYEPGGAPIVLDREGEEFARLLPVQREIVEFDSLPEHVGEAFIAVEDRRFRDHGGVDFRRVAGAMLANLRAGGVAEGGSTITMQLARNAFPDHLPASQRTLRRKLSETRVAMKIEDEFDKDQILGLYLNQIYFGNGATGIAAASRHYFGIPPSELRPEQAALLAAMVKAPAHYDPREDTEEALERRNLVLDLMHEAGYLTDAEHQEAKEAELDVVPRTTAADAGESLPAPWFLDAVQRALEEELGSDMYRTQIRVHTTLDAALQRAAEEALEAQLRRVEAGQYGGFDGPGYDPAAAPDSAGSAYLQGAVVALEPLTGGVLALVGGRNHRHSEFDHAFDARRQVGSAFKPFVYGAALQKGLGPSHRLDDSPLSIEMRGSPTYRPENYDGEFRGPMTAREALRHSRNVPTVRLGQEVGTDAVAEFAEEAGVEGDIPRGPSMVLGTVTLSPVQLARAYASFAGLGRRGEPHIIRRVETAEGDVLWETEAQGTEETISPAVAYVLDDMLQDVVDGGTGGAVRAAGFRGPAAGKTGTTQDGADVWYVGFTPDVVGVVWMGFDQPRAILSNASGGVLAAPVWGRMMAEAGRAGAEWEQPPGVVRLPYDPATGRALPGDCFRAPSAPTELFVEGEVEYGSCAPAPDPSAFDTAGGSIIDTFPAGMGDTLGTRRDTGGGLSLDSLRLRDRVLGDSVRVIDPVRERRDTSRAGGRVDTTGRGGGGGDARDTGRTGGGGGGNARDTGRAGGGGGGGARDAGGNRGGGGGNGGDTVRAGDGSGGGGAGGSGGGGNGGEAAARP